MQVCVGIYLFGCCLRFKVNEFAGHRGILYGGETMLNDTAKSLVEIASHIQQSKQLHHE